MVATTQIETRWNRRERVPSRDWSVRCAQPSRYRVNQIRAPSRPLQLPSPVVRRFRTDMLLGSGTVPLSPLLQGAWVDGYAPLYAVVASSVGGELREERVQVGGQGLVGHRSYRCGGARDSST